MRATGAALKVGITVLAVAVASFWAWKQVSKRVGGNSTYTVWALFHNAAGLADKSRVQVAGLTIGNIVGRGLQGNLARITVRLGGDIVLYDNAVIMKKAASLLGEFYLEIDPGLPLSQGPNGETVKHKRLGDGDQIQGVVEAVTAEDIMREIKAAMPTMRDVLADVRRLVRGPVTEIANNVNRTISDNADVLHRVLLRMDAIGADVERVTRGASGDVLAIVANVKQVSEDLKELIGKGQGEVTATGQKLRARLDELEGSVAKLDRALGSIADTAEGIAKGQGTVGRLVKDDTIAKNVEQITEDVGSFTGPLSQLQTVIGLRSEFNVLASSLKTYVAIELQPRPDKFYLIELVDDPRGSRKYTRTFTQTNDPTKPQTLTEDKVEISDKFRFTFQFGKRVSFAAFRFGIKESTGGIGTDLYAFRDRLKLSLDLFDFRANEYPRLKGSLAFEFWNHMYVVGGFDDIINDSQSTGGGGGRDYFVGGQVRFNDADLKALLTVGGTTAASVAAAK